MRSTNKDWQAWGKHNPFYGVVSDEKYLNKNLTSENLEEFYSSGTKDIQEITDVITKLNKGRKPKFHTAVDFGSGTGRLSIPLTDQAETVIGIDVSPDIINTAKANMPPAKKKIIKYLLDPSLDRLPSHYDLVVSHMVLQHIKPKEGYKILQKLLSGLDTNGFAAIHVTLKDNHKGIKKFGIASRNKVLPLHYAANVARGRSMRTPRMRMFTYSLDQISEIFYSNGFRELDLRFTQHGSYFGVMIAGKKIAAD